MGHGVRDTVAELLQAGRLQPAGQRARPSKAPSTPTGTPSSATSTPRSNAFLAAGEPVISVDTKKKELVGGYTNGRPGVAARRGTASGERPRLPAAGRGKAVPYGVYDIAANSGWVTVGVDHDTAVFAVDIDPPLVEHRWAAPTIPTRTGC